MRFLLDENAEFRIAAYLQRHGHDVKIVQRDYAVGLPDPEILALAISEARIIVTNDRDFGDLVFRDGLQHSGIRFFRFPLDSSALQKIAQLEALLTEQPHDLGKFIVLTPNSIRVGGESRD